MKRLLKKHINFEENLNAKTRFLVKWKCVFSSMEIFLQITFIVRNTCSVTEFILQLTHYNIFSKVLFTE